MSAEAKNIEEGKTGSIPAGMLDDVIKDFKIIHGALASLGGIFDIDEGDYWEETGKLDVIEVALEKQDERLKESIEELCRLAGRPVYPKS